MNGSGDGGQGDGNKTGDDPLPPELEDSLNNSGLSDEERQNIRNALNGRSDGSNIGRSGGGGGRGRNGRKDG